MWNQIPSVRPSVTWNQHLDTLSADHKVLYHSAHKKLSTKSEFRGDQLSKSSAMNCVEDISILILQIFGRYR